MLEELLNQLSEEILTEIREAYRTKTVTKFGPVQASGKTAAETIKQVGPNGFQILAPAHVVQLLLGRRPGTRPPISVIEQWLQEKGLDLNPWAVAKNIEKKGTTIYQTYRGNVSPLFDDVLNDKLTQRITERVGEYYKTQVSSQVFNETKI